ALCAAARASGRTTLSTSFARRVAFETIGDMPRMKRPLSVRSGRKSSNEKIVSTTYTSFLAASSRALPMSDAAVAEIPLGSPLPAPPPPLPTDPDRPDAPLPDGAPPTAGAPPAEVPPLPASPGETDGSSLDPHP